MPAEERIAAVKIAEVQIAEVQTAEVQIAGERIAAERIAGERIAAERIAAERIAAERIARGVGIAAVHCRRSVHRNRELPLVAAPAAGWCKESAGPVGLLSCRVAEQLLFAR
jgi:hypothetical protein